MSKNIANKNSYNRSTASDNSYNRIIARLKPLNLYKLDGTTLMDYELECYAFHFDMLRELIDDLFKSCFIDNINYQSGDQLIKLFKLPEGITLPELKKVIKGRMSISNSDFTIDGVKRCLETGGFTANIEENFATNTITVHIISDRNLFSDPEQKRDFIKQCIPCHLNLVIVF